MSKIIREIDSLHPARIEVSLKQLLKNIRVLQKFMGKSLYCLPLKANAYGHGLHAVAKLAEKAGIDYLAVAHLSEGVQLRMAGIQLPILILSPVHENEVSVLVDHDLEFSISSKEQAESIRKKISKKKCRVHLRIDTGMQCTGIHPQHVKKLLSYFEREKCFELVGVYSHLATADKPMDLFARKQIDIFKGLDFSNKSLIQHICNSGGMLFFIDAHLDMVRPGLATFGYLPDPYEDKIAVAPCFSLKAKVSYSKIVQKGERISYGHTYKVSKTSRIITIPVGYGDGYLRTLSNKGFILLRGKRFPIVGSICMDQFMVNVGDMEVKVGEEAVLIGKQGNQEISIQEIARLAETIPYEVLCLFNERIPRFYIQ